VLYDFKQPALSERILTAKMTERLGMSSLLTQECPIQKLGDYLDMQNTIKNMMATTQQMMAVAIPRAPARPMEKKPMRIYLITLIINIRITNRKRIIKKFA
jgi:hypothetical protein